MSSHCIYLGLDFQEEVRLSWCRHARHPRQLSGRIPPFLATLTPCTHLVCESTGSCHRAGHRRPCGEPRPERQSAAGARLNGLGRRAKTDPIDAQSLYDFGRMGIAPRRMLAPSPTQMALQELVVAAASKPCSNAVPLLVQIAPHSVPLIASLQRARIAQLTRHIAKLEAALTATLAQEESSPRGRPARSKSRGSALTATTALALCPELGTLSGGQAAALLGVAPFNHDSGQLKVQRPHRRRPPAAAAPSTWPPSVPSVAIPFSALSTNSCAPRQGRKVALTAIMRKLFLLLNHLLKNPHFVLAS